MIGHDQKLLKKMNFPIMNFLPNLLSFGYFNNEGFDYIQFCVFSLYTNIVYLNKLLISDERFAK